MRKEISRQIVLCIGFVLATLLFPVSPIIAQQQVLDSQNLRILDVTIGSGGGVSEGSSNFDVLTSAGNPTADARLESQNYAFGSGFPSSFQANVPLIRCAEASTTSGTTNCLHFPNANGAQGECGTPGCYDRVKVEIDPQQNPIDTLYLLSFTNTNTSTEYFVTTAHTVSTAQPTVSANYMTICELQGRDDRVGSGCETGGDPEWDADLQRYNVIGLVPGEPYNVRVRALSGDFTETQFSPVESVTLEVPALAFDIDIAGTGGLTTETTAPYAVSLGVLSSTSTSVAQDRIWLDMNTNLIPGLEVFVRDTNNGLSNGTDLIPAQSEDLAVDPGGDGGFGLKIDTTTSSALGPLINAATYDTATANSVGATSVTNTSIFETNDTGANNGPITEGRASVSVQARQGGIPSSGTYSNTITFSMIANL